MATFTIKSHIHGEWEFFVPDNGGYVRVGRDRHTGPLGLQICYGGGFRGNTVTATAASLEREARVWWRQYLKHQRGA